MEYAAYALDGANLSASLTASLGFNDDCPPPKAADNPFRKSLRLVDTLPPLRPDALGSGLTIYVDGVRGSDSNTGTSLAEPFKTLRRAQTATAGKGAGTTVLLRRGTYYLQETLKFGPKDSFVSWAAYNNEKVVFSGGVDLSDLKWSRMSNGPPGAMQASLPPSVPAETIKTLFVNGVREIRAKFPNGDPLIPGGDGWSATASGPLGEFSPTGVELPHLVQVFDVEGRLLSSGGSSDSSNHSFTVAADALPAMTGRGYNPTRQDFHAYTNFSAERFNTTWNSPFWNSQVSPGFRTSSLTKPWKFPASGIVHMYHTGAWGGWQFQVAERPASDEIMFACRRLSDAKHVTCPAEDPGGAPSLVIDGGFQECRGAQIGKNNFYVENIEEVATP